MTTYEYSTNLCMKYQMKVRGLSGRGMQIAPSIEDPDRSCRVACQDKFIAHRFYLVNGDHGFFPFGINCSFKSGDERRFCVNGKCIKFGSDDTPANGVFFNNFNSHRMRRSVSKRNKRYYTHFANQNYSEHVSHDYINNLVRSVDLRHKNYNNIDVDSEHIDLNRPVDVY
jgi:thrombospondin motif-containing protein 18